MEILGIGASELLFILIIALIVLGPKDMQKAGRTVGRWLNHLVRSDSWKVFQRTSAELRNLPRNLMRDANMEVAEMERDLRNAIDPRIDSTRPAPGRTPGAGGRSSGTPPKAAGDPTPGQPPAAQPTEDDADNP